MEVTFKLNEKFQLSKYTGKWYELIHYPSWFQPNDAYNTTARYRLKSDGTIEVINSTIVRGKRITSVGTAVYLGGNLLRVDFAPREVENLNRAGEFGRQVMGDPNAPNYIIDSIWQNQKGEYLYAVVTDSTRTSLWVLSRFANPSLDSYNRLMEYVLTYFDRTKLVQTPHFSC